MVNNVDENKISKLLMAMLILMATAVMLFMVRGEKVYADAPSASITEVNYENSTLSVGLDSKDTCLLMSDSKMKKWEYVPAALVTSGSGKTAVIDISWIQMTRDTVLSFKGDYSSTPVSITIPKQKSNFKVTYDVYNNAVKFTNADGLKVQWKKKDAFTWNDYSDAMFSAQLDSFISYGAGLVFRIAPCNGTSAENPGSRASKEVSLNIPRKTAAPAVVIDDVKLTIAVNKNMEYRYADDEGNPLDAAKGWSSIGKTEAKAIRELAPEAIWDGDLGAAPVSDAVITEGGSSYVCLQFRNKATTTAQKSYVTTVKIPVQSDISNEDKNAVTITYTSSTTLNLNIPLASENEPFEYCVITPDQVKNGVTIDSFENLTWKKVSSPNPVSISRDSDQVKDGSSIYVRKSAVKSLGSEDYKLASNAFLVGRVKYPGEMTSGDALVWMETVAGVCNPSNPEGYLVYKMYSPTENVITKIRFVGYTTKAQYGSALDSSDFKSEVELNPDPKADDDHKYVITTTIMNTAPIDKYSIISDTRNSTRAMLLYMTIGTSSEEYQSNSTKGVGLYIHPATTLNNPVSEAEYNKIRDELMIPAGYSEWSGYTYSSDKAKFTNSFVRMVDSNRYYGKDAMSSREGFWDASSFKFRLDFGTRYNPAADTKGEFDSTRVTVTKIKYDGAEFTPGSVGSTSAFYVEYADTKSASSLGGEDIRTAIVTVNADVMEKADLIDDRNSSVPVIIYLSNGEILKKYITMNLQETASIHGGSNSWTITAGSLKEVDTVTTTENGVTVEKKNTHVDQSIVLDEYAGIKNVSLISVTWNGIPVCSNIKHTNGTYAMDIDNAAINKISVDSITSHYLVFTFDNGFKITTGWKLTINPAAK